MFIILRTITYAALFAGVLLVYLPARLMAWTGFTRPASIGGPQLIALVLAGAGALTALWCISTFVRVGKGTPAPFDPPRRLVIAGPYRFVRNPMYMGGGLALGGAALYFASLALLIYGAAFLLVCQLFILLYEEPTLRQTFGPEYHAYCHDVRRWLPRM